MKYLIVLIVLFTACSSNSQTNINKLHIDLNKIESIKLSDISTKSEFIKLDNNNGKHHIGTISKFTAHDGKFFILDSEQALELFVYSDQGEFIYSISSYGRGPGEFLAPIDFGIKNDSIIIYDLKNAKFIYYDIKDGRYLKETPLDYLPKRFHVIDNNYLLYNNNSISGKDEYNVLATDMNLNVQNHFLKINKNLRGYIMELPTNFYQNSDDVYFTIPLDYTVYKFNLDNNIIKVNPHLVIDFGEYSLKKEFFNENLSNSERNRHIGSSVHSISNYYENADYIYFNYWSNDIIHYYIKSKRTKKEYHTNINNIAYDIGSGPLLGWPIGFIENTLVWHLYPNELFEYFDTVNSKLDFNELERFKQENKDIISFSSKISEKDNPFLIFINLNF